MNNYHILRILYESSLQSKHDFDAEVLRFVEANKRSYQENEFAEFKRDLTEAGQKIRLVFMQFSLERKAFTQFLRTEQSQILVFARRDGDWLPILVFKDGKKIQGNLIKEDGRELMTADEVLGSDLLANEAGELQVFVLFPYKSLISEYEYDGGVRGQKLSPVRRLIRLLSTERKDITYILFYSVIIGLLGLVLPLGIQTTVELISGGVFFSSVYVLIAIVLLGVLLGGGLQIVQISLVEHLQRRVFAKASFEFAYRIPRIRMESILKNYAPELVNRFFDVMTVQKGLPKLLIDLSSGLIQILFGLLLLSLYHPFFVFFSLILLSILGLIFYMTGPSGLDSSIKESKYKYKVAQWLEELARALNSFKLAGNTDLPVRRTDEAVNNYLHYRKKHFRVLVAQFSFIVLFKAAVTAALLIMGTILVVNREITLGQFVASEVIIILILNSVEKVIMYMDVVYDLFTAVDKISQVTDLPLEKVGGLDLPTMPPGQRGYAVSIRNLSYKYPDGSGYIFSGLSLDVRAGERVCIAGPGGSGKTTLTNIIAGLHGGFEGVVTINGYSIRDLDLTHLRDSIAKNISAEDIFDGTILENITVGKPSESMNDAIEAIRTVGADDAINSLPDGVNTHLISGGKGFSSSMINKIVLARCLAKKPKLLILNDFFSGLKKAEKLKHIQCVTGQENAWTLIAVSNDPLVMAACDRVVIISQGKVEAEGVFRDLLSKGMINPYID